MQFRQFPIELLRQEVDIVLCTVTKRGRRNDLLRLVVVDFDAFQAPKRASAEDNRKLAKAFSSVLPVLGLVHSSSRVGALLVADALEGTHRYSVEAKTTLLLRKCGETESTS